MFSKKKCSLFMLPNVRPCIAEEEVVVSWAVTTGDMGAC